MSNIVSAVVTIGLVSLLIAIESNRNNKLISVVIYSGSGLLVSLFAASPLLWLWFHHYSTTIDQLAMAFSFAISLRIMLNVVNRFL